MTSRRLGCSGVIRPFFRFADPNDVQDSIAAALAHNGPVLVDAVVNRQGLATAPRGTMDMVKGFSLFMVETVMNGRTNEIIELARANLSR